MSRKNLRRLSILVTAQTAKNLERLRDMAGYASTGQVVDKLTRDRLLSLRTCIPRSDRHHKEADI